MEKNNIKTKPSGGFPPIFICDFNKKKEEIDSKIRGFSKEDEKIVASLKDIMGERRKETKPFIEL
jgi:hypothetical protein